ncbi:hypothetical protein A1507_08950 [Methylomonas koyamae]|uniref:Uncharacterized protein n=1 Tax=Methylomonas koyamae TaxID=702114 RepID=A0A177NK88_9GAMM|nr:hypothetical protein A1507_08950 [Methylomonas koyamae]
MKGFAFDYCTIHYSYLKIYLGSLYSTKHAIKLFFDFLVRNNPFDFCPSDSLPNFSHDINMILNILIAAFFGKSIQ